MSHLPSPTFNAAFVSSEGALPFDGPATRPRSARLVARVAWAFSPGGGREDVYHLSTNRARSHWILWVGFPGELPDQPYAYCARGGLGPRTAAKLLLRIGWSGEQAEYDSPGGPPGHIGKGGLLSEADVREVGEEVWAESCDEAGDGIPDYVPPENSGSRHPGNGDPYRSIARGDVVMHAFGGFPYLVTRIAPGLHHVILVPPLEENSLAWVAREQWAHNRLPTCVCLSWERSIFINASGFFEPATHTPFASLTVAGLIHPAPIRHQHPWPDDRSEQLAEFIGRVGFPAVNALHFRLGGSTKNGREASAAELKALSGRSPEGAPFGLSVCPTCSEFRGTCLDPSPELRGLVVEVTCRCVNDSRCGACGEPFSSHQLDSNLYDPENDAVCHLSALGALEHCCREG